MDGARFDALARVVGGGPRRPLLQAGLAALVVAGLGVAEALESEGKGKGKEKGKREVQGRQEAVRQYVRSGRPVLFLRGS